MNFSDSDDDAAFRAELIEWLESNSQPRAEDLIGSVRVYARAEDEAASIEDQRYWQRALFLGGWAAITWPKAYGGRDATATQAMIFREELSRFEIPNLSVFLIGHGMIGPTIITHGTEDQRARYISPLAEGRELWCQLWSEPNAGSDLASLETRADLDPATGEWVLRGQKVWTTYAHAADWGLCLARTNPDVPKHAGLSVFIVNMKAPGVTVRPLRQITGDSEFNEVFFDDVRLAADSVVGGLNDGWRVAITTLMNERYAGGLMGDLTELVRPLFELSSSAPIGSGGSFESSDVRQELGRAFTEAKLISLTGYRSLSKLAKSESPGPEGSILKLCFANLTSKVALLGMRLLGLASLDQGPSAQDGGVWPMAYLTTQASRIAGGTDDVMRNIIAERVLQLPKEYSLNAKISFREAQAASNR